MCEFSSNYKTVLKRHQQTHSFERPYICDHCDFGSIQAGNLQTHIKRVHLGEKIKTVKKSKEKRHICSVCGFAFSNNKDLRNHTRTHTNEKPFKCNICDFAASQKGTLNIHMNSHNGTKTNTCDKCDFATGNKYTLKIHMKIHTGEKNFKCNQCPFESYQNGNLKSHMKIHGEKTIHCNLCNWSGFRATTLKAHTKNIHSGEKPPHQCEHCDYASFSVGHMRRHMKMHPGEI